jgi:hypothetical protein
MSTEADPFQSAEAGCGATSESANTVNLTLSFGARAILSNVGVDVSVVP